MIKAEENKKGYKKTTLGWIPEEWDVKNFSDCCNNDGKYGINAPAVEFQKKLPTYLRITDIDENGKFIESDKKSVDRDNYKQYILKEGDIVFARTGATVGKTYLYNKNDGILVYAGFLIKFHPTPDILIPYFIKTFTDSFLYWKWVKKVCMRSGQPGINSTEYGTMNIPLPPIEEQKIISIIFYKCDRKIELTNKLIKLKEKRKKALMQQLLTGKKRLKEFKDKWINVKIGDIAKEINKRNGKDKEIIVLSCTKYDGLVPSLEYFGRKIYSDDLSTYKVVPKHTFAYATNHIEEGSIGYQESYDEALISPMYTVFKTNDNCNDDFIYKLLKTHRYIHEYNKRMEGSINRRGGLRWDEFSKIKLSLPSFEEQSAISNILKKAEKEIELIKQKLEFLKKQKQGLIQVLLTGKVRVNT